MADIFLPTLHTFAMENIFTGSCGQMRYRVKPAVVKNGKDVNMEESSLTAQFWHGPFCYEKSEMEGEKTFPMSAEGWQVMKSWLEENV